MQGVEGSQQCRIAVGRYHLSKTPRLVSPDEQISVTDPDLRSMATGGRGSGVVGYNVHVAVDTEHHLIVTHEVTNTGSDRSQLITNSSFTTSMRRTSCPATVAPSA